MAHVRGSWRMPQCFPAQMTAMMSENRYWYFAESSVFARCWCVERQQEFGWRNKKERYLFKWKCLWVYARFQSIVTYEIMKKILFVFSLLLSIGAQSQNIITLGDADNGYILPENINPYLLATQGGVPNYFIISCIREGNVYPIQPTGTRIYGIACMLCDNIPDSVEIYAFLYSGS